MTELMPYGENRWRFDKSDDEQPDVLVYLNRRLRDHFSESGALKQLQDATQLPGVVSPVLGMPDLHQGYGLPIGGVMAMKAEKSDWDTSVVSAGAVGYDINCGVRLLSTKIESADLKAEDLQALLKAFTHRIPAGVGKSSRQSLGSVSFKQVVTAGAAALVREGYGRTEDLDAIEELGALGGARLDSVSKKARSRADQLATIGGGNHFIELGTVAQVYDRAVAETFGLHPGALTVMIHTGSRGFGHEICTQYTARMSKAAASYGIHLPSKGLACVPIGSPIGQDYLAAMACAVNYAFANRQLMTNEVRGAFADYFAQPDVTLGLDVVYDVAHNIAKFEDHRGIRMLIHRKGATRALSPGHPDNPPQYRKTGHPVIIPGSMGTSSYVVTGTEETAETFYSANHGAGRLMSRTQAKKSIDVKELKRQLGSVIYGGVSPKKVLDEAPAAYKDIDDVVDSLAAIGLTRKVVRLEPLAVIKGA